MNGPRLNGSPDQILAQYEGNHRNAEVACWEAWEREGKPEHSAFAHTAIAIAERYHYPTPSTEQMTDAAIRKLELAK